MREPVCECSEKELIKLLNEWKERLFLNDWTIKVLLVDELKDEDGEELLGLNTSGLVNKDACIRLTKPNEELRKCITKFCIELNLVHELLHCKMNLFKPPKNDITGIYYDTFEHSLLEQMAKSLIMAKYNIPFKWFNNF